MAGDVQSLLQPVLACLESCTRPGIEGSSSIILALDHKGFRLCFGLRGFEASKRGLNPAGTCSVGFEVQGLLVVLDRMRVLAFSPSHRLRVKGLGVCRGMGRGRLIL